jgi:predicted RNA-binding protein with PUA-like domain
MKGKKCPGKLGQIALYSHAKTAVPRKSIFQPRSDSEKEKWTAVKIVQILNETFYLICA